VKAGRKLDAAICLLLLLLPLLWFFPQTLGGKTLLPADNLYEFEPWASARSALGVGTPHNGLISDLILENYPWKQFLRESLRSGQIPLWNPRLFAGVPFLAAGQHSALYPLSAIFYIVPLWRAYGIFTWLQLGLAAVGMYVFARVLRQSRTGAAIAAIAFAFSGFYIVSVNFTMMIAAAAWLPPLLAVIEIIVHKQEEKGTAPYSPVPYVALGALLLALQILAGHIEITYYVLLVSAFYAAWRLIALGLAQRSWLTPSRLAGWLVVMMGLGGALGGVQLAPFYDLARQSFREGSASFRDVLNWAWPSRQLVTFVLPDFFGNPTHHGYFDVWTRQWLPVTRDSLGNAINTINWGVKNYVEGGNYLGLITLLLAGLAVAVACRAIWQRRSASGSEHSASIPTGSIAAFTVLAVLSLLFAFGTPLYAVLFYLAPGYKQLHSAFRWVYPYTLCMALLAGYGATLLARLDLRRFARGFALGSALCGAMALGAVLLSLFIPTPFVSLGTRLLRSSDLAQRAFTGGAMLWSYEAIGLLRFGALALAAALALWYAARHGKGWYALLVGVLILDLWLFGHDFNSAVDPRLLDYRPPVLTWLQQQANSANPWRFATFDKPGEKLVNANSAMPYGLEDIRGYDSVIPKPYVNLMERIQHQGELIYNRIAPLYSDPAVLTHPLLNLLGARYVLTTQTITNPAYRLAFDGPVKAYENSAALPRTFIASRAISAPDQSTALDLAVKADLRNTVVIEGLDPASIPPESSPRIQEVRISQPGIRQFFLDVNVSDRGWLVFTENWDSGWKAYLRPFGSDGEGVDASGQPQEDQVQIYRADGAFRAIYLAQAGQWTVRFVYSPRSYQIGLYASFLSGVILLLLAGAWAWGKYYRDQHSDIGRAAKNSLVQMVMSLVNKGIDFAFAMLRMRVLSPSGEGSFFFAINFYLIFEILTRFGLGTLLTRDVAQHREDVNRYLSNVIWLRVGLWLLSLPIMALVAMVYRWQGQLTIEEGQAIAIFAIALLFANLADAISAVFNAFEKMEYPAGLATATTVAKVGLGALVLLPPFQTGFVGLAAVSLLTNVAQVIWLYIVLRQKVHPAEEHGWRVDRALQWHMLRESGPLMINNLLATVFWRIDLYVLRMAVSATAVGIFSAGTKYLDGLNVIPSYFTLAIFPLMSRYAREGTEALTKAYRLAAQLLFIVALPIAVFCTFAATDLIRILGGAAYLPGSATALSIMIWSIPIGFVNSVTQYVLIAINRQRFLTRAFVIGVIFTAIANLLFVPKYGYIAAAAILIPAELSLFFPFAWAVQRYLAPMPWLRILGQPALATLLNAAAVYLLQHAGVPLLIALAIGLAIYVVALQLLGTFRSDDFGVLLARFRRTRTAPDGSTERL
jgi:O-antigen/teichoic acid export membrane protein